VKTVQIHSRTSYHSLSCSLWADERFPNMRYSSNTPCNVLRASNFNKHYKAIRRVLFVLKILASFSRTYRLPKFQNCFVFYNCIETLELFYKLPTLIELSNYCFRLSLLGRNNRLMLHVSQLFSLLEDTTSKFEPKFSVFTKEMILKQIGWMEPSLVLYQTFLRYLDSFIRREGSQPENFRVKSKLWRGIFLVYSTGKWVVGIPPIEGVWEPSTIFNAFCSIFIPKFLLLKHLLNAEKHTLTRISVLVR